MSQRKTTKKAAPKRTPFVASSENIKPFFVAFVKSGKHLVLSDSFASLGDARAFSDINDYIFTVGPKGITFVEQITADTDPEPGTEGF